MLHQGGDRAGLRDVSTSVRTMPDGDNRDPGLPTAAPPTPRGIPPYPSPHPPPSPEALAVCPECGAAVSPRQFGLHLRRAHRVYQFRGVRRNRDDTLAALLGALFTTDPD